MKELEKLIMEIVAQLHAPTALPTVHYGYEARMLRMECTPPQNYYPALLGFLQKMKESEKLIMEIVSQLHAPTALPPVPYG
jgi:hypothetical protein